MSTCVNGILFEKRNSYKHQCPRSRKAGVFTPRERDWQRYEVIVDNNTCTKGSHYLEVEDKKYRWQDFSLQEKRPESDPLKHLEQTDHETI